MAIKFEHDEHVLFESRRHWFVFATEIMVILFFLLLPVIVLAGVALLPVTLVVHGSSLALVTFFYSLWLLAIWTAIIIFWTDYYLDVMIVTNKRIIDIEQHGLFHREISYLSLDKIQDVKSNIDGIIPTLLEYGDVYIQSAGQEREFIIRDIKGPNMVRERLNDVLRKYQS